eukprot:scaffold602_cov298-Pinguiococcus_pyrenoidosus.AAC.39
MRGMYGSSGSEQSSAGGGGGGIVASNASDSTAASEVCIGARSVGRAVPSTSVGAGPGGGGGGRVLVGPPRLLTPEITGDMEVASM